MLRPTFQRVAPGGNFLMVMRPHPDAPYADVLRAAMDGQTSRRQLSVALAAETGNKRDSEYRALGKYLSGDELPSRERAAILAVLLGSADVALVPASTDRRRDRLGEVAEAMVEILENQREMLQLLRDAKLPQRRAAAPTRTR